VSQYVGYLYYFSFVTSCRLQEVHVFEHVTCL